MSRQQQQQQQQQESDVVFFFFFSLEKWKMTVAATRTYPQNKKCKDRMKEWIDIFVF
jgi:hypothetical protein